MRIARGTMGVTLACATSIACGVFPSMSELATDAVQPTDGGASDAAGRDDESPPAPEGGAAPDGASELDAGPTAFSETWTGDDGTEWPATTWAFLGDQASFLVPTRQGSQGKVNPKTVVAGGAIQLFAFPNPALIPAGRTISQRIRVRGTSGAYRFALLARGSGLDALPGSLTGYALDCWSVDCQIGKFVAGKYTKLLEVSSFGLSETDTLLAFEVAPGQRDTTVIRAKAWHDKEPEPAFKTYSDSDVALASDAGFVGLRFRSTVDYGSFTIDDYVVTAKASE